MLIYFLMALTARYLSIDSVATLGSSTGSITTNSSFDQPAHEISSSSMLRRCVFSLFFAFDSLGIRIGYDEGLKGLVIRSDLAIPQLGV